MKAEPPKALLRCPRKGLLIAAIGAVYATLERLEAKQFVQSREEFSSAETGARVRRMYRLTAAGQRAIEKTQHDVARMMDGMRMGRLGFKTR